MPSQEVAELKEMIESLDRKLNTVMESLLRCQSRCHVENTPGKWRGLGRALLALVRF